MRSIAPTRWRTTGAGHRRGGIGSSLSGPRRWYTKHDTIAVSAAASRPSSRPVRSASATTRSHSVLSRDEELAAREQLPAVDVAPRLQHREHAVELAGEGLGPARDAALEPGDLAGDAVGLPGAAQRDVGARPRRAAGARARGPGAPRPARRRRRRRRRRSGRRRSSATAARWKLGLRGANGRGSSTFASRRIGPGKSSGVQRTIVRCWVSASTRLPDRPRSCFSTTARPPRFGAITTSPGRSLSSRLAWAACAARRASSRPARSARYSSMSPLGCCAASRARSSCARVRSSWRVSDTASRSAWYCANDRSRRRRASVALVALHEVGGHVVGRAERRRERVGAPRREAGDLVEARRTDPTARPRSRPRRCRAGRRGRRAGCTPPA